MSSKLREVLLKAEVLVSLATFDEGVNMDEVEKIRSEIKAALAEPVLNCEVGTAEEQAERYGRYCDKTRRDGGLHCETCPCCGKIPFGRCEFAWAQMPYETVKTNKGE